MYFNFRTAEFAVATNDTVELIRGACWCIDRLYRKGYAFKKCGIILTGLVPQKQVQANLFDDIDREKSRRLMRAVDAINARLNTQVRWAAEGISRPWQVEFNRRSGRFTTCWDEIPEVA
jgi:DNA polymerase V